MTLTTHGHWGCVGYIYIGSAADGVEGNTECIALEFNATAAKTYAAKN